MNNTARLVIGQPAPGSTPPVDGGRTLSLGALRGSTVVLEFYAKDDTSGCTSEAHDFSANLAAFETAGAVVIGLSKNRAKKRDKFVP